VIVATPDHWHASIAIDALNCGKDVYLEKPLTFTIAEGRALVNAVRQNKRILQVGSQQRSDAAFQHAVKMVHEGKLGKLQNVIVNYGAAPTPYDLPRTQLPAGLDWDKWLGPLPLYIHYNDDLNPPISLEPRKDEHCWGAWRWYRETGGGYTTDWGAHMIDIAQWGIGADGNGPVEVIPPGVDGAKSITWKFANGVTMVEGELPVAKMHGGVRFEGEKGWIEVTRSQYHASNPEWMYVRENNGGQYEEAPAHYQTFIDSMRSRKDPNAPVEIGHSTCTSCTLANIALEVKHAFKWDPVKEEVIGDPELMKHRLFDYVHRKGYTLND
jgi:predicted dehydrogenase